MGIPCLLVVEQSLPDPGVVDVRGHVHPVLQQPPVGLGHQGKLVTGAGHLITQGPLLRLENVRPGPQVELVALSLLPLTVPVPTVAYPTMVQWPELEPEVILMADREMDSELDWSLADDPGLPVTLPLL